MECGAPGGIRVLRNRHLNAFPPCPIDFPNTRSDCPQFFFPATLKWEISTGI